MRSLLLAAVAALAASPAAAHEVKKGAITIEHPLVRASLGKAPNSAAYAVIRNTGTSPDRLLGAECACAARVELHGHVMQGQVARMRKLANLAAPAGGRVALAPSASHLMIFGLKQPLESGTMVKLTLRFERAGRIDVPFFVTSRVDQELNAHRTGDHAAHAH